MIPGAELVILDRIAHDFLLESPKKLLAFFA